MNNISQPIPHSTKAWGFFIKLDEFYPFATISLSYLLSLSASKRPTGQAYA